MKPLRYFNGRCQFLRSLTHGYIAAHTKAEAIRIGKEAFGHTFTATELNKYWAECWGTDATEVIGTPLTPGAYIKYQGRFYKFVGKTTTAP